MLSLAATRPKTLLACDTCRKRKSRCDGVRPKCTHCRINGSECIYRPPPNLDTDISVLARLADLETRMAALENLPPTVSGGETAESPAFIEPPHLHTAASYLMLDGWPRLRLHVQDIRPMDCFREADLADRTLIDVTLQELQISKLPTNVIINGLEHTYRNLHHLPWNLAYILACSPTFDLSNSENLRRDVPDFELHKLELEQLLLLSIGCRSSQDLYHCDPVVLAETCFALAMQRQWLLHSRPTVDSLGIMLVMAICLVHFWARPFHCLGLLQSLDALINRLALNNKNNQSIMERITSYTVIYGILESDLLTELDGFPTQSQSTLTRHWSLHGAEMHQNVSVESELVVYIQGQLFLRNRLNQILHDLYAPDKASVAPHEVGHIVDAQALRLRQWSRSLPLDQQFSRDIATFNMSEQHLSLRQRELALRYFTCVFLLNRPILYFYLHKELEYSIQPPEPASVSLDSVPWVHESCRDCVESAALLVYIHHMRLQLASRIEGSSWCDTQLLFACYLVLLQVKPVPNLASVFKHASEVDRLLDMIETIYEALPIESFSTKTSLMLLRTERQGFERR